MIEQAFEVATEFRFDIGSALVNTNALTNAVGNLSTTADQAMNSLNYLAGGLVANLGLGSGGLLSMLKRAVEVSDEFQTGMFGFLNSINSNTQFLTGTINTFNDRLATSKMLMNNVNEEADKFGLSGRELAQVTSLVASPLAARGRAGKNYSNAIGVARNMMLTSEAVGLPQQFGAEMLVRGMTTGMLGGKLFERLANTPAFRAQHIMRSDQISPMRMNDARRMDLLTKALEQLGGNAEWLAMRMNTLQAQFARLKTRLDQLLRPIGDALKAPIILLMTRLNDWLKAYGPQIGRSLGDLITAITNNPNQTIIALMQLSRLKHDLALAFKFTGLLQVIKFVLPILKSMGLLKGTLIEGLFFGLGRGLRYLGIILTSPIFVGALRLIGSALAAFLPEFLIFAGIFQILSRARAQAHVFDVEHGINLAPQLLHVFLRISRAIGTIFSPITTIIRVIADFISPLFRVATYGDIVLKVFTMLADTLDNLANDVILLSGIFVAFNDAMTESTKIKNIVKGPKGMEAAFAGTFNKSMDIWEKHHPLLNAANMPTSQMHIENNNHIEARFDMREQLEPDRIAFAVTTHLKKLAISATQGRGGSLYAGLSGNQLSQGVPSQ